MKKTFSALLLTALLAAAPLYAQDSESTPTPSPTPTATATPEPMIPEEFRGNVDPAPPSEARSIGDLKWFEVFQDIELQNLINQSMLGNFDVRSAIVRLAVARAQLGITGSNEFPHLTASADISTVESSLHNPNFIAGYIPRSRSVGEVLLNILNFEIDIWGRLRHQTQAAVEQVLASEEDHKAVLTMLVSQVATDYFDLIELDEELDIAKRTLVARTDSLEIIKARQEGGVATMLEVRQGEQLVQQAALLIPDTQRQIEQTENNIQLLLGRLPGPVKRGPALSEQTVIPAVPAGLPSELLFRRPDILSAEHNLESEHELVLSARAAFFPTISLTTMFGFQSSALANLLTGGSRESNFAPQIVAPIFDAGNRRYSARLAEGNEVLSLIKYQQVVATAFNEVSNALVQYSRIREVRVQQESLVETLKDRSKLSYLRYRGGVDSLLNALDADRDLFSAQLNLAQAKRNELLSIVQLYKALGGGWQR